MLDRIDFRRVGLAVGCLTAATLVFEFVAVRLLSALLLQAYAFTAISLALLGMSAGAVVVYFKVPNLAHAATYRLLAGLSLVTAVSIIPALSFAYWYHTVLNPYELGAPLVPTLLPVVLASVLLSVPFFFSSAILAIVFRAWPGYIGRLYLFDFIGAAGGCLLFYWWLSVMNPVQVLLLVAGLVLTGAYLFHSALRLSNRGYWFLVSLAVLAGLIIAAHGRVFGPQQGAVLYADWNPSSYVTVLVQPFTVVSTASWRPDIPPAGVWAGWEERYLRIDNDALTPLLRAERDLSNLGPLRQSLAALPYYLAQPKRVAVIGSGGGSDVMTALLFGGTQITAIEVNRSILNAVRGPFYDYIGQVYERPEVTVVNAEARNYLHNVSEEYDLIVSTLVDSWAAQAAGVFATSETFLYTQEAFATYLQRLSPQGVVAVVRWVPDLPKLLRLSESALREQGVSQPEAHLLVFRYRDLVNVIVSRQPLSEAVRTRAVTAAAELGFGVIFPTSSYTSLEDFRSYLMNQPLFQTIDATTQATDDKPFFFNHSAGLNIFSLRHGQLASRLLVVMFWVVILLVMVIVVAPLGRRLQMLKHEIRLAYTSLKIGAAYFALSGAAFFLLEIILVQKLILFLGKPEYALVAVVFSLLWFGGWGSLLVDKLKLPTVLVGAAVLPCLAVVYLWLPQYLFEYILGWSTLGRLVLVALLTAPLGFLMGMPFPVGVRLFASQFTTLTPWFWGVSSAASVLGSLLAVVLPLNYGLTTSWWVGILGYLVSASLGYWFYRRTYTAPAQSLAVG